MDKKERVLAIDFNNVTFMGYYSKPLINSKGMNVNAIKSFFFKLKNFIEMFEPNYIVFASDLSRSKTFRRQMFPPYKAQRGVINPEIIEQMKYISQIVALLGFKILNNELFEADDILGMISRLAERNDMQCIIISSDKDLYQLVTDNTWIYSPPKNIWVDKEYMMNEFSLRPNQWIDLKTLQGDRGDNIPGINGIGNATAMKLMQEYGSIENIYEKLDYLSPKLREILEVGRLQIPLMRKLVTIVTDYSLLDLSIRSIQRTEPFPNEIFEVINELEIKSLHNLMYYKLLPQKYDKIRVY